MAREKQQKMQMKLLVPGFELAIAVNWRVNQKMEKMSYSPSAQPSSSVTLNKRTCVREHKNLVSITPKVSKDDCNE